MSCTYDKDPYMVLGVSKDADEDTIKKAYRKLALQHHPDRKSDPVEKAAATKLFADISGAYEILTDTHMRKEWDREAGNMGGGGGRSGTAHVAKGFKFDPSDPYDVWKKDFEDQFGRPYPGSVADVVSYDTHIYQKREGPTQMKKIDKRTGGGGGGGNEIEGGGTGKKKGEVLLLENGQSGDGDEREEEYEEIGEDGKKKKKKGFFAKLFGKKDKKKDIDEPEQPKQAQRSAPTQAPAPVPAPATKKAAPKKSSQASSKETALVVSSKNKKDPSDERALAVRNNERSVVEREEGPDGIDNRPISMEVAVEELPNGGTITTTTITRPDGTVEKCVQRTGMPGKNPKEMLALEGEKKKLAIEGEKTRLAIEGEKKMLAIENGGKSKQKTNHQGQLLLTSGDLD